MLRSKYLIVLITTAFLGFLLYSANAQASETSIQPAPGSGTISGPNPATIAFPFTRSGDTAYDVWIQYKTEDGTAHARTDFAPDSGVLRLPAGAATVVLPIKALGTSTPTGDKQFKLVLTSLIGVGPKPSFADKSDFAVGSQPVSVTTADVNGDGRLDLVAANAGGDSISVNLNTTAAGAVTPSFATKADFATGESPTSVAAADVNNDGRPDLITGYYRLSHVSVLLNTTPPGAAIPSFENKRDLTPKIRDWPQRTGSSR